MQGWKQDWETDENSTGTDLAKVGEHIWEKGKKARSLTLMVRYLSWVRECPPPTSMKKV